MYSKAFPEVSVRRLVAHQESGLQNTVTVYPVCRARRLIELERGVCGTPALYYIFQLWDKA